MASGLFIGEVAIRLLQVIFGILAASLAGVSKNDEAFSGGGLTISTDSGTRTISSFATVNFFIYTGASSAVIAAIRLIRSTVRRPRRKNELIVELIFTCVWIFFWLAAVAALPVGFTVFDCGDYSFCGISKAAWAFGFISILLWIVSSVLLCVGLAKGGSEIRPLAPPNTNFQMGAPPAGKPVPGPGGWGP